MHKLNIYQIESQARLVRTLATPLFSGTRWMRQYVRDEVVSDSEDGKKIGNSCYKSNEHGEPADGTTHT